MNAHKLNVIVSFIFGFVIGFFVMAGFVRYSASQCLNSGNGCKNEAVLALPEKEAGMILTFDIKEGPRPDTARIRIINRRDTHVNSTKH